MAETTVTVELEPGRPITIGTGKLANLAKGAVTVRQGDTIVLVAVCDGPPRGDADFFPLQVDYREKFSAAGRIPGGYIKREGRPTDNEILVCRMTDRPVRPLFPKGYFDEVQIQGLVLSADDQNLPDTLAMLGASAALAVSPMPFLGPIGAVRVGCVDGKFVANPTRQQMATSTLDLVYAGLPDKVIMIEGDADECSEEQLRDALLFANDAVKRMVAVQVELAAKAGRPKATPKLLPVPAEVKAAVVEFCRGRIESACMLLSKQERIDALGPIQAEMIAALLPRFEALARAEFFLKGAFTEIEQEAVRAAILDRKARADGRGLDELRPLSAEVGLLPRTHGSGLFARGETQALVQATLGSGRDAILNDTIYGDVRKSFYLHYNFPNFSVGETGRIMGPGRREIGHGNLAERSVAKVMPKDFPYAVRCVSEVMASNGSTSMASICGATLALMDAGVPIKGPVAGISCGLVTRGEETVLLTDILGSEDHYGDMDFKVAGTKDGITGFQLDLKIAGISIDLLHAAMLRNREARMKILDVITACLPAPRPEINRLAPKIVVIRINPEKIGALIGPGGKIIRGIQDETGAEIQIDDNGTVSIFAVNSDAMDKAVERVNAVTAEVEIGKIYRAKVRTIKEFGAFVEILPGQDGLVHISELANYRVDQVTDICKEGDMLTVKVIDVDERGRVRLSRKAALAEIGEE
jgi:polyribonucleotide nucleotidyltransferase